VIVIGRGRLIADAPVADLIAGATRSSVRVRTTEPDALAALLRTRGAQVSRDQAGALDVAGLSTDEVGPIASAAGITLLELAAQQASLEEAFLNLTQDAVEFRALTTTGVQR
jgi:ABC-2 type transport system ATP-binding protein